MPMREECKHYQSRTYPSGEVARLCVLDLAPEAPWRCPGECARYERRLADAGWVHGSLVEPPLEDEPEGPADEIAQLLGAADGIVNAVAAETIEEVSKERQRNSFWGRYRRLMGGRRGESPGGSRD
jgi:hypothetical protein